MKTQGFKLKELLAMGLHTYNPGTLEAEEEDIHKCESGLRSETLSQTHALPKKLKEICGAVGLVGWVKYLLRKHEDISRNAQNARCSGLLAMLRTRDAQDFSRCSEFRGRWIQQLTSVILVHRRQRLESPRKEWVS